MLIGALWAAWPIARAHAFSDPEAYKAPVEGGGGAGRWFTGSPADGFGCDACHEGAPGVDLTVVGLPTEGFVPGMSYEVSLAWPPQVQHLALIAEFSDELRQGAGTVVLPRPDVTGPFERCTGELDGFPSSAIHDADAGRKLVSVVDCGARIVRFQWTAPGPFAPGPLAPAFAQGPVWFNAGFVVSNADAAPGGDGVTLVSRPLPLMGTQLGTRTVAQGCSVSPAAGRSASFAVLALFLPAIAIRRRAASMRKVR